MHKSVTFKVQEGFRMATVVQEGGPRAAEDGQLGQERLKRESLQSKCKNTMHAAPGRNSFIGGCPVTAWHWRVHGWLAM